MSKRLTIKIIVFLMIAGIFNIICQAINPLVANYMAMYQMENYVDSSMLIQVYSVFSNYQIVVLFIAAFLLFYKDIKKLIKSKGERSNEEK